MKSVRNAAMVGTFVTVVAAQITWKFANSYLACVLALVVSFSVGCCVERVFIKRTHREMNRLHGPDWRALDGGPTGVAAPPMESPMEFVIG
ncbi:MULTISPECIES: hypothetical protein [unclassified Bradyrhizobium]|uniref:hypothetical protein n=1 Tax=unclassified Bradyrhizobium TaxID=2631580 RepID=UPI0020B312B2|nr:MULTISPECIES: hypothetical protein [unclassified Bradyrhizobium]MCP3396951.1 hypothetical protein [Bradyrhizobium sp. CCGB20]MCP3405465.1 hypothetical protein [Bradyrhizobium sp. CCGB01]